MVKEEEYLNKTIIKEILKKKYVSTVQFLYNTSLRTKKLYAL